MTKKGVTLVELMLGLMIFGLISTMIYSVFSGGIELSRRSEHQNEVYREATWTFDLITLELENMLPYNFVNSYPDLTAFSGSRDKISFIIGGSSGLRVVSYYLVSPSDASIHSVVIGETFDRNRTVTNQRTNRVSKELFVREERSFIDFVNERTSNKDVEIIASNIKADGLTFSFGFLENEETQSFSWEEKWDLAYIPSHIRIELEFVNEQQNDETVELTRDIFVPTGFLGQEESLGEVPEQI